jgi:DNA helicase-2/ATP-dependent DNA helicase PcrA
MSVVDSRSPSRLLEGLNPEQLAAVTLPPEPALILAGAGSGKTRVLTTRIAWLIQTGQLSPGGVLAVTFTNKAAKEMLTRLDAMLAIPVRGMWVGTFHGLCNRFLRIHWKLAALPQGFQILDSIRRSSSPGPSPPPRTTACAPRTSRSRTSRAGSWSRCTTPTRRSASAKAWSTSPS